MKRNICKSLALVLCIILGSTFTLGAAATAPVGVKITDGYYFYSGPNTGNLPCFIRFNEDGTYYAKFFGGGVMEAGMYVVLDKELEYFVDAGADSSFDTVEDNTKATAKQVVALTNYATGAVQEIAFDDDKLCDATLGGMSKHNTLEHKADYIYDPAVEEIALAVQTFYYENDTGSSLTLYHNRTFNDFTTAGEDGTWALEGGVFTLTTSEEQVYTLTVSDSGWTATYVKGSDTLELTSTTSEYLYSFAANTTPEGLPMEVTFALNCKPDGTCEAVVSHAAFGDIVVDTGTYAIQNMVFISFELATGGKIDGVPDMATATEKGITVNVPYKAEVTIKTADAEMTVTVDCTLAGEISAK